MFSLLQDPPVCTNVTTPSTSAVERGDGSDGRTDENQTGEDRIGRVKYTAILEVITFHSVLL
jgi:hypothetical protein